MDKVKNRLNPPPIYVRAGMSIFEAVKRMKKHEVSAILVIEGKNYVGVFTEADLLIKVVAQNESPSNTLVAKVITKDLLYIDSESSMATAFLKMQTKNICHLSVKENNDVTGVLSIKDVAKYYVHKFSTF